ncbi:MAG: hypothetical protein RL328_2946 [Acidobacteriota bacterium]|jgi:SAM-dependent methyltransferase
MATSTLPVAHSRSFAAELYGIGRTFLHVFAGYIVLIVAAAAYTFPYQVDSVTERGIAQPEDYGAFYKRIYSPAADPSAPQEAEDANYVALARAAIQKTQVIPAIQTFVRDAHLEHARVLDVGSGTGYLQDIVENYVGLDISPTASRYYHKPFIQASATEMPIPDNDFDLVWSVWVLEHVPNPEQALMEMRRVVKDGGYLYLAPAWNCSTYLADGYPVRPFSDYGLSGKLIKAGMYLDYFPPFYRATQLARRAALATRQFSGPTRFHYRPLTPNYEHYWLEDSDAINSLDRYEMALWFTSRGDECLNCDDRFTNEVEQLVIRVHKH